MKSSENSTPNVFAYVLVHEAVLDPIRDASDPTMEILDNTKVHSIDDLQYALRQPKPDVHCLDHNYAPGSGFHFRGGEVCSLKQKVRFRFDSPSVRGIRDRASHSF